MQLNLTPAEVAALANLLKLPETGGWIYASRPKTKAWDAIRKKLLAEKGAAK